MFIGLYEVIYSFVLLKFIFRFNDLLECYLSQETITADEAKKS